MNLLPVVVTTARVPPFFSPSHLRLARSCRLRAVLSAGKAAIHRLPAGPAAEVGTVFHELYRRAALGALPDSVKDRAALEHLLDRLFVAARHRLAGEPETANYADLPQTLPAVAWRNKREGALRLAAGLLADAPAGGPRMRCGRDRAWRLETLPEVGRWPEVVLESSDLRLSGRADLVEKRSGEVTVTDFKSGSILGRDGEIRPHLRDQMLWYGLVVQRHEPNRAVLLRLRGRRSHDVDFGGQQLAVAEASLAEVSAALPAGAEVPAAALASPGPGCVGCRFRAACPGYRQAAPHLWTKGAPQALPRDTWGEVLEASPHSGGTLDLLLRDAAGRLTRVERLSRDHFPDGMCEKGEMLWLFGLEGRALPKQGIWHHPRNFHERSADSTQRRSWGLVVFRGGN